MTESMLKMKTIVERFESSNSTKQLYTLHSQSATLIILSFTHYQVEPVT